MAPCRRPILHYYTIIIVHPLGQMCVLLCFGVVEERRRRRRKKSDMEGNTSQCSPPFPCLTPPPPPPPTQYFPLNPPLWCSFTRPAGGREGSARYLSRSGPDGRMRRREAAFVCPTPLSPTVGVKTPQLNSRTPNHKVWIWSEQKRRPAGGRLLKIKNKHQCCCCCYFFTIRDAFSTIKAPLPRPKKETCSFANYGYSTPWTMFSVCLKP